MNDNYIKLTTLNNKKLFDYLKELINSGLLKNKFLNSTQRVNDKYIIQTQHKIRKDYTLTIKECSIIDMYIFKNTGLINHCNHRERWKILFYNGNSLSFRGPHKDWSENACHRKLSIIICLSKKNEYSGGELVFNDLKKKYKLDLGDVIIFNSKLTHEVLPITSGKRYVLTSFTFDDNGMDIKKVKKKDPTYYKLLYPPNNSIIGHQDIDYSGLYLSNKYTDSDCYLYEKNDSDILFVTFSGLGCKNTVPTFIFHNFFKKYDTIDKLFLRDIKCQYYLTGLEHNTNNINETIQFIQDIIKIKKYKKIVGIGCSAGGFAAILYGNLLKFDKIIAFAPQVVINNDKIEIIKDNINAPKTCKFLTNYSKDPFFQKCLNLKSFIPFIPEVEIHFPELASNGIDKRHAEYIQHNECKIIGYESNNHRLALELRDNGILQKIIDNEIS